VAVVSSIMRSTQPMRFRSAAAPKGHDKKARGNAPGNRTTPHDKALKGRNTRVVSPFQGLREFGATGSRGVAPGCFVTAFQAEHGNVFRSGSVFETYCHRSERLQLVDEIGGINHVG